MALICIRLTLIFVMVHIAGTSRTPSPTQGLFYA